MREQVLHLIGENAAPFQIDVLGVSRRERHGYELQGRFLGRAPALVIVAAAARGDDVARRVGAAAAYWRHVVARELGRREARGTVHADVGIAAKQGAVIERRRVLVAIALDGPRVAGGRDDRAHLDDAAQAGTRVIAAPHAAARRARALGHLQQPVPAAAVPHPASVAGSQPALAQAAQLIGRQIAETAAELLALIGSEAGENLIRFADTVAGGG